MKGLKYSLVLFAIMQTANAQVILPLDDGHWSFLNGRKDSIGGRKAFSGLAQLKDVEFKNGTIEWDLWASGGRSYAGVIFHKQDNNDGEEVYIRPHKANGINQDALQYTPLYHGTSCWQLFHGDGCTMAAKLPYETWIHFTLSVKDDRAVLRVDTDPPVTMYMHKLVNGGRKGQIRIKAPADGSAYFSHVKVSQDLALEFPDPPLIHSRDPGIIPHWEISQPIQHNLMDPDLHYSRLESMVWDSVSSEPSGLVNLTRERVRNPAQPGWVYARTSIHSERDEIHKYQFGYSDNITLFVNSKPIMKSVNGYLSRDPGFAGLIGYFDEVFLPLQAGNNEICLLIGEQFGGWGFQMRDGEAVRMAEGMSKLWEIEHQLHFPESVVFDPETGMLYSSNFLDNSGGGIARISLDGQIDVPQWVSGLKRPTGICIARGDIYVVERGSVVRIDKNSGAVISRISLEGSIFPNDIASAGDGTLFVSDNASNRIYKIENDTAQVWMEGGPIQKPNGIEYAQEILYVGCTEGSKIIRIDAQTKEASLMARLPKGSVMDGLQVMDDQSILLSDYNGHLFRMTHDGAYEEILNTVSTNQKLADFEYIRESGTLIIPGLFGNNLTAYKIGD